MPDKMTGMNALDTFSVSLVKVKGKYLRENAIIDG
jgi:hypothetical protein